MNLSLCARLAVFTVIAVYGAWAGLVTPITVVSLLEKSDMVVVAELVKVENTGSAPLLTLLVNRSIKGSVVSGSLVSGVALGLDRWAATLPEGEAGVWFLRKDHLNTIVMPHMIGSNMAPDRYFIPALKEPLPARYAYKPSEVELRKLLAEMSAATEKWWNMPQASSVKLFVEFASSKSPDVIHAYRVLAKSESSQLRYTALAGLVGKNDFTALSRLLEVVLSKEPKTPDISSVERMLVYQLTYFYRGVEPAGIRMIGDVAANPALSMDLRRSAAICLAQIHTRETLVYLAQLLDDDDFEMRSYAVGGLSAFANNLPVQGMENVDSGNRIGEGEYSNRETMRHSGFG